MHERDSELGLGADNGTVLPVNTSSLSQFQIFQTLLSIGISLEDNGTVSSDEEWIDTAEDHATGVFHFCVVHKTQTAETK